MSRSPLRVPAASAVDAHFATPQELAASLSARRRRIIGPALQDPRRYVLLSVRALAAELGSDPATILRIIRALGFGAYREFQHYLHELSIAHATSLERMKSTADSQRQSHEELERIVDRDIENLHALRASLDTRRLEALAGRIHDAQRIAVFGGDLAIALVHYLEYHLALLGLPCLAATTPGRAVHLARALGPRDLALALSFKQGLRQTIEGLKRARANGAYCVGITDTHLSPLTRFADEFFLAAIDADFFGNSYTAPVALLNTLLAACANHRLERTMQILEEADEEQRFGSRWYTEDGEEG